ncbi:MAG: hypothetical protein AAF184_11820 [Pseudomonadota bacterium]
MLQLIATRILSALQIVFAIIIMQSLIGALPGLTWSSGIFMAVVSVGLVSIWICGIWLWNQERRGVYWAQWVWGLQIPIVALPWFQYDFALGAMAGLAWDFPWELQLMFRIGVGNLNFSLDTTPDVEAMELSVLGANVVGVAALVYLTRRWSGLRGEADLPIRRRQVPAT